MRVVLPIALCSVALAAHYALADDKPPPAAPDSGVTVNLGALPKPPAPTPRHKPSPEQMRALLAPMPRPKPTPEQLASTPTTTTEPPADVTPPAPAVGVTGVPMPRPKPVDIAAAAPAPKKPKTPELGSEALPAHETALTSPQSAADAAAALRGATMSAPPAKPVNPLEGFSVLTRVRFASSKSELGADAKATLDTLAARLLANEERVRLAAFSGVAGDMSSETRRLSLARALAVRTYLVSKGVPVNRVDVLAFGGSTDGTSDRVDVLIRKTTHSTG